MYSTSSIHLRSFLLLLALVDALEECPSVSKSLIQHRSLLTALDPPKFTAELFVPLIAEDMLPDLQDTIERPNASSAGGGLALAYHKTGHDFALKLMGHLETMKANFQWSDMSDGRPQVFPHGQTYKSFYTESLIPSSDSWFYVQDPSSTMPLHEDVLALHFYRSPVPLILSAARYHIDADEQWMDDIGTCHTCDKDANDAIFELCNYTCSYRVLLAGLDESHAVLTQALESRSEVNAIVANLKKWGNNRNVLHISMNQLETDWNKTVTCMLNFLGMPLSDLDDLLDINIYDSDAENNAHISEHITTGKFDNSAMEKRLRMQWGSEFEAIEAQEQKLWKREARMYGCPIPED